MTDEHFISIPEMIEINARTRRNTAAIVDAEHSLSWYEFHKNINAVAGVLIDHGVKKGASVALLIDSSIWSWTQAFAVIRAGGVLTPLNTMLPGATLADMLTDCGATHFIVSKAWRELGENTISLFDGDIFVSSESGCIADTSDASEGTTGTTIELLKVQIDSQDAFNIIYSSGTTGLPKGIVQSHGARVTMALVAAQMFRCSNTTRLLLTTPPHTNGSFMVLLPTIAVGGTIILSGGFSADRYFDEVEQFKPTLAFMVPTIAQVLVDHPRASQTDFSSFDFIVTAGAPMSDALKRRTRTMTGDRLGELWGFTEGVASIIQPHEMADHMDSVGRASAQCELRVIDEDDRELPAGELGELVGRSAYMMAGYHNRPEANEAIIWHSSDGWNFLRTGDLGVIDAEGWVTIKGRKKDMLISGGLNIYPADIESVAIQHESIRDCAVVGVRHQKWGETPVAFVELYDPADADELKAWINALVGRHQRLHDLIITPELPRNTLGKVLKHELAAQYDESHRDSRDR